MQVFNRWWNVFLDFLLETFKSFFVIIILVIDMQFERLKLLMTENDFARINKTTVLILGVGGVGSYVVESLVRSGIGHLILVDYDIIDITNLNRQLMTTMENIGEKKVDILKKRILSINPACQVTTLDTFYSDNNYYLLDQYHIDYIVDACDTINSKKTIINYALNHKINIISSMGTGNKFDPTKLSIMDIRKTSYDPLARILRKWVNDQKIKAKIPVVSSSEKPLHLNNRVVGSTSFVPSTAGLLITSYIISDIIHQKNI